MTVHDGGGVGFCGGLTTFSTYAVAVVDLLDRGRVWTALAYSAASVAGAITAAVAGAACLRGVRALTMPVEA